MCTQFGRKGWHLSLENKRFCLGSRMEKSIRKQAAPLFKVFVIKQTKKMKRNTSTGIQNPVISNAFKCKMHSVWECDVSFLLSTEKWSKFIWQLWWRTLSEWSGLHLLNIKVYLFDIFYIYDWFDLFLVLGKNDCTFCHQGNDRIHSHQKYTYNNPKIWLVTVFL